MNENSIIKKLYFVMFVNVVKRKIRTNVILKC